MTIELRITYSKQLEIDEYNNYEKALGALTDAYKCMMKHKTGDGDVKLDQKIEYLKHKMNTINRFVKAKRFIHECFKKDIYCDVIISFQCLLFAT